MFLLGKNKFVIMGNFLGQVLGQFLGQFLPLSGTVSGTVFGTVSGAVSGAVSGTVSGTASGTVSGIFFLTCSENASRFRLDCKIKGLISLFNEFDIGFWKLSLPQQ